MVETRSKKSAASRDVAAIQQSVPSVRDVVMSKRGKADGSRPASAASAKSTKSVPTTVSAGHATESFPLATPSPSATPRRTRAGGRGTRSTPSTPPSHRRLLPRSLHSPRKAPGSGGHGEDADDDAACAERSIDSHVTQFAESLRALRELGLAGIRDFGDDGFREASEEQESEQMRVLLEERSRARELVRQLERDKELQAEELRLMEMRIVEQEMTEEELVAAEEEVTRARLESAAMATAKEALEHELALQMDQNARWSEKLRAAESEEAALLATAEKAERALAEKEAEAEALAHRLTAAERELDALRAADVDRALRAAGAGSSGKKNEDEGRLAERTSAAARDAEPSSSFVGRPTRRSKRSARPAVKTSDGTNGNERARGGVASERRRKSGASFGAVVAAVAAAALGGVGFLPADARAAAALSTRSAVTRLVTLNLAAPREALAIFSGDGDGGRRRNASVAERAAPSAASADAETPPWLWFEADLPGSAGDGSVGSLGPLAEDARRARRDSRRTPSPEGTAEGDGGDAFRSRTAPGAAAAPDAALETVSATVSTTRGTLVERRASSAPATAEPSFVATEKATKRRAASTPLLAASALDARAAEEDAWDEIVSAGWAAWRRLGGSDRRARVKTAARRAESAVLVAKEGREACAEAARRYDALLAEVEAARLEEETSGETGGAVGSASAAERQRLTLASHEVDAETAGSERKWESLRDKAVQATRALETELRALG